jgi:hypothetical protein
MFRREFRNSAGKLRNLLENKISGEKTKPSAGKTKNLQEI